MARAARLFTAIQAGAAVVLIGLGGGATAADAPSLNHRATVDGLSVGYPDGWSAQSGGNVTVVANVPAGQAPALETAQVRIFVERRTDPDDAVRRLDEIAAETDDPVTRLTVGGWPAIQRRHLAPWPRTGPAPRAAGPSLALTITTAIAAESRLVRLDGSLPADAPAGLADTVAAIETSVSFGPPGTDSAPPSPVVVDEFATPPPRRPSDPALTTAPEVPAVPEAATEEEGEEPPPISSPPDLAGEGAVKAVLIGGVASEPEVAVSSDGKKVVVAQQFTFTSSLNGGKTFPGFGTLPAATNGDVSLAYGKSGTFYAANISGKSTSIDVSTDGGQTFSFRANAFTCGMSQCGFNGGQIPDQEHIAADRLNGTMSGDQVYSAFRNGFIPSSYGIVCSTDSGSNWGSANFASGDFPRVSVGPDGSVYVAYVNGTNIMLNKYAACSGNAGMAPTAGFPKTVATGVADIACPVPGLDRCNDGNTLRSPMVAVDDTNAAHVYVVYARNTGSGNENVFVQDSTDAGVTWSRPAVQINGGGTARRFMPWVCATNGTAFVSWYDRRSATGSDNDLTDYFGATAALDGGGNLAAGSEFQINALGTADTHCEAGFPAGDKRSWPGGSRAQGDSESCSRQPQLAGLCGHNPFQPGDSQTPCDFNQTACPMGESCQLWGGGTPKYGDYNGNACAVGHFYTVWASATPPGGQSLPSGIHLFFAVRDTIQPAALCKNVTLPTAPNVCYAFASIDNGSNDPDGDTFTLSQSPPQPYDKGTTGVTLTITDQNDQTNSCSANVTVLDQQQPGIACPSPVLECTSPSGAAVPLNPVVSDNCPGLGAPACLPPSGSTFPLGTTAFSCNVTDASSNTSSCSSTVKVQDTTPPIISSVAASPNLLWPPNHKLVPVAVSVAVADTCDPNVSCTISSVSSNEPMAAGDFQMTGPLSLELRSERLGTGSGRVYTIAVSCKDAANNSASASTTVTVPHDQGH